MRLRFWYAAGTPTTSAVWVAATVISRRFVNRLMSGAAGLEIVQCARQVGMEMVPDITDAQLRLCLTYGADSLAAFSDEKLGISDSALAGAVPLNGLRHPKDAGTSGWFIWGGEEWEDRSDFFTPLYVSHLKTVLPLVLDFLALAPGWRFLLAPGAVDVSFDESLLVLR